MVVESCCCGLIIESPNGEPVPVPLTGVSVQAKIIDLVAEVIIEQRYINKENNPIEAVYKFPLDEGAGVCGFTAEVDGRVIKGVVKETETAKKNYNDALESGHSAFLLTETLPDVFKAKVGNLPPGSGAKIRLTYVTELKVESGEIRFFLPTTIAPRYVPASDQSSAAQDLASIPYTKEAPFQLDCDIRVKAKSEVKEIRCPTHKMLVTKENALESSTRLTEMVTAMDRDLVLYIQLTDPHKPRLIYEKSEDNSAALMLSIVPSFKLVEQKTELIFIVDRSGSMQGSGIVQAKQALKIFLHSLPADCYVNIVGFGSRYETLYPASRRYDDTILAETKAHAETLQADLGGTEIYQPLERIFQQPTVEGYLRQIFLLTDGEVSNTDQIISLVRQNNSKARVFALGLGSSASHHLIEGLARAGNGTALFASLEERLEKKVLQQLQDALQPAMTDVSVQWDGLGKDEPQVAVQTEKTLLGYGKPLEAQPQAKEKKLRQAPSKCPPVFDGKHLVIYALLPEGSVLPSSATLSAASPVGPLTVKLPLDHSHFERGQLIHTLAAKKLIQELQDENGGGEGKKEIIELGCKYHLASRFTSYVAVDPKEQTLLKESFMMIKSRDVPNTLAHGYGGHFSPPAFGQPLMMACDLSVSLGSDREDDGMRKLSRVRVITLGLSNNSRSQKVGRNIEQLLPQELCAAPPRNTNIGFCHMGRQTVALRRDDSAPLTDDDRMMQAISMQRFDGSFIINDALAQLLDTTLDDIKKAGQDGGYAESLWTTVVVLAFLSVKLSQLQDSWVLVAAKGENWLRAQQLDNLDKAKQDAEAFVKSKLHI